MFCYSHFYFFVRETLKRTFEHVLALSSETTACVQGFCGTEFNLLSSTSMGRRCVLTFLGLTVFWQPKQTCGSIPALSDGFSRDV